MPIKHSYNPEQNVVKVEAAGELTISEIETYAQSIIANEEIALGFIEIFNLKGVKGFNFSFECGKKVMKLYSKLYTEKKYRGAIHLSPTYLQYGISHIISAFLEDIAVVYTVRDKEEIESALKQFE